MLSIKDKLVIGAFMTGNQIKAARMLLGWSQNKLSKEAGIHPKTVQYWERHDQFECKPNKPNSGLSRLLNAFESAGAILTENGVRIEK